MGAHEWPFDRGPPEVALRHCSIDYELLSKHVILFFQDMLRYKKNVSLIIFFAGFLCGISVTSLCGSIIFHLLENFKDEDEVCMLEQERSRDQAGSKNKAD